MARTLKQIEKEIEKITNALKKIDDKEKKLIDKGEALSNADIGARSTYQKQLDELLKEKDGKSSSTQATAATTNKNTAGTGTTTTSTTKTDTSNKNSNNAVKPAATNPPKTGTEKRLEETEKDAQEAADDLNNDELEAKKTEDAKSAAKTAKNRANQIDANVEENVPTWLWREAQEMAPNDKAKRGFIITNHILNRLGTTLGNVGAVIQNAGGSGGAKLKEHGGSYIDQYRQSKIEQAMTNRKTKQNSLLQQQIDALVAIGVPENEARAIQNKLRNSAHWNKYNRLTNEQQVYIQGLLYNDASGKISDAVLGNFIDQLMEGKDVSMEQAAVNTLAAAGIDNVDNIKSGATSIADKVAKWLGWQKYGE